MLPQRLSATEQRAGTGGNDRTDSRGDMAEYYVYASKFDTLTNPTNSGSYTYSLYL